MTLHCIENKENYSNTEKSCLPHNITYNMFEYNIAELIGVEAAILFNQIKYWISKCGRTIKNEKGKWIYNSLPQWNKQFSYWSMYKLRKTIKLLEDLNLIKSTKANSKKWNHTKWYTINYNEYEKLLQHQNRKTNKRSTNKTAICKKNHIIFNNDSARSNHKEPSSYTEYRSTDRSVENQQIIITNNNYTNNISSNKKHAINSNKLSDKKVEEIKTNSKEKEIVDEMLYVWNKVFEYSVSPIKAYSSKKNEQTLVKSYKTIFNRDLDKWREYALQVNSSQFLMGEKKTKNNFKAVFSWLIKEETIGKILNGEYGVGDRELDMNNVTKNVESKKEEIVNKMDRKISEYIKIKINDKKEREEFKEYVKTASITEEDSYGVLKYIMKQVPKNYVLEGEEYKGMRENLYESYIMKKYIGYTKLEIRKEFRKIAIKIDEITNVREKIKTLRNIEEKIETKELKTEYQLENEGILNNNSGILESMLLSN